jgi:hypothetical protein
MLLIQRRTAGGPFFRAVRIDDLTLPNDNPWRMPALQELRTLLVKLVRDFPELKLVRSHAALELLSQNDSRTLHLELCTIYVTRRTLETSLRNNSSSIHSIRVHDVEFIEQDGKEYIKLLPVNAYNMVDTPIKKVKSYCRLCGCQEEVRTIFIDHP